MSDYAVPIVLTLTAILILLVSFRLLKPFSTVTWNNQPINGFAGFLLTAIGLFLSLAVGLFVVSFLGLLLIGVPFFVIISIICIFVAAIVFLILSPILILFLLIFGIGRKSISSFSKT